MDKTIKYPDFWAAFLNGMPLGVLFAGFLFAIIGVALNALLKTTKRDPLSERTPTEFSWNFFWNDNVKRLLKSAATTIIVIFLSIRFFKELTGAGSEVLMLYSFGIGFGIDKAIWALRKKTGTGTTNSDNNSNG